MWGLQLRATTRLPTEVHSRSDPQQLLSDAQDGDPDWGAIFLVVRQPMRRAARSSMLTMGVDDVPAVDDALVLGFRRLQRYGLVGRTKLVGFARSVAYNAGRDTARALIRRREFFPDEPSETIADPDPTPEELVVIREDDETAQQEFEMRYKAAIECLETLTPGQREAVVEVEMGDKNDSELADETGVSHTAIWKRRTKGIEKLKECVRAKLANRDDGHEEVQNDKTR